MKAGTGDDFCDDVAYPSGRGNGSAVADIVAVKVCDDVGRQQHVCLRMRFKYPGDGMKGLGQVLFVTVQMCGDVCIFWHSAPRFVNGIVHAGVGRTFVAESIAGNIPVLFRPILQPGGRAIC